MFLHKKYPPCRTGDYEAVVCYFSSILYRQNTFLYIYSVEHMLIIAYIFVHFRTSVYQPLTDIDAVRVADMVSLHQMAD